MTKKSRDPKKESRLFFLSTLRAEDFFTSPSQR